MKLDEINRRPPTLSLSTRVDLRHLATLAKFWSSVGERSRSISELSRLSLEGLAEMLSSSGLVEMVSTQADAQAIISEMGLELGGLQKKNLLKAIMAEGRLDTSSLTQSISRPQQELVRDISGEIGLNLKEAEQRLKALFTQDLTLTPRPKPGGWKDETLRDLAIHPDDPINKGELE